MYQNGTFHQSQLSKLMKMESMSETGGGPPPGQVQVGKCEVNATLVNLLGKLLEYKKQHCVRQQCIISKCHGLARKFQALCNAVLLFAEKCAP